MEEKPKKKANVKKIILISLASLFVIFLLVSVVSYSNFKKRASISSIDSQVINQFEQEGQDVQVVDVKKPDPSIKNPLTDINPRRSFLNSSGDEVAYIDHQGNFGGLGNITINDTTNGYGYFRYLGDQVKQITTIWASSGNFSKSVNASNFYSGGNVGIGTTSPGAKLDVNGTIAAGDGTQAAPGIAFSKDLDSGFYRASSNNYVFVANNRQLLNLFDATNGIIARVALQLQGTTAASAPTLTFASDTNTGLYSSAADNVGLVTGGSDRLHIDSSGNVGIGTTSPSGKLSLYDSSAGSYGLSIQSASGNRWWLGSSTSGMWIAKGSNVDSNQYLYVASSGNVGIGTSSPDRDLVINSPSDYAGVMLNTTSGNDDSIVFSQDATTKGSVGYDDSDSVVKLNYGSFGSGSGISIDSSGNVGIGTTSPIYPLTVATNTTQANQSVSIWASGNISAIGFIDRTSIYDLSRGSAWDFIQDSDYYKNPDGTINHKNFYGYVDNGMVPDYNKPIITPKETCNDVFNEELNKTEQVCTTENQITYNLIHEEGDNLGDEIAVLRQALYKIKTCTLSSSNWGEYQTCVLT